MIIQTIRFKNKFRYEIKADDDVLQCLTLKLILQPLVENAIHHGIEKSAEPGFIEIAVSIVEDHVEFKISDNGIGMDEKTVQGILKGIARSDRGSGVGVINVQERISLYYGSSYGLHYESEPEEGTIVTIKIPVERMDRSGQGGVNDETE
ncbi:Sensor histidine kinase YpdA [compost metagenome]